MLPSRHRFLLPGEVVKAGTRIPYGGEWIECNSLVDAVVNKYSHFITSSK